MLRPCFLLFATLVRQQSEVKIHAPKRDMRRRGRPRILASIISCMPIKSTKRMVAPPNMKRRFS